MKNYVPLFLANIFAGLAAWAIWSVIQDRSSHFAEPMATVVTASKDIPANEILRPEHMLAQPVRTAARPRDAISWKSRSRAAGQQTLHAISAGDFILVSDLGHPDRHVGGLIPEGQWAVPLPVGGSLAKVLRPGDEVAVIASFSGASALAGLDAVDQARSVQRDETTAVVLPRVRVLTTYRDIEQEGEPAGGHIIVSLPPQEALVLIAAQRRAEITLALRRPGDTSVARRCLAGKVDGKTFEAMFQQMDSVVLSAAQTKRPPVD